VPLIAPRPTERGTLPPPVRLLRSSWLERRAKQIAAARTDDERRALALPSRRALEASEEQSSAFMRVDEVLHGEGRRRTRFHFDLPSHEPWIVTVSLCSLSADHPDPRGEQLVRLVDAFELERARTDRKDFPSKSVGDTAVFLPWCSLYTPSGPDGALPPAEADALTLAMESYDVWLCHSLCRLLVLDVPASAGSGGAAVVPREARGLPTVEHALHSLARHALHAARTPPPLFATPCVPRVPPIHTAAALMRMLEAARVEWASEGERSALARVYASAVERVCAACESLHLDHVGWGDDECAALAELLPSMSSVTKLHLSRNAKISHAGAAALAAALLAPGAAPRLREVRLEHTAAATATAGSSVLREVSRARDTVWYV
jgi:hypothetical protein